MKNKISQMAKSLKNDVVSFLREIIAIPSVSGQEEAVIGRIKHEMEKIGFKKVWIDPFGNLLGILGSGNRLIVFDGHCDTVGIGNPDTWECDPFKGKYENNTIYGRGAADQKGGLASAIYAGRILKELGIPEDLSILVVASVLEEDFEGICWQYIIEEEKIQPEAVLLTEPTNMEIKIGQRGRLEMKVRTEGISCHGSAPHRGDNAIYKIGPIIQQIKGLNEILVNRSVLGKGTVTITNIESTAPSLCAVADSATLHLDRRLSLGETMETSLKEVAGLAAVKTAKAKISVPEYSITSYTGFNYQVQAYYPMWLMERSHPLIILAENVYKNQFSKPAPVGVWGFSTNGVATMGRFNIPTFGFGPGNEEFAHTPKDQVSVIDLLRAMEFYAAFAINYF
jgi:putative selenium metabolism hydrolase